MSEAIQEKQPSPTEAVEQKHGGVVFTPRFDIWETDDELVLYGDLPGVHPNDLDVRFEDGQLSLHGRVAPRQSGVEYLAGEYGIGDFHRSFAIGEAIDTDKISAELKNGVLTLCLPKSEAVKPRRIQVNAG
jgi:HSP20 family protein